MFRGDILLVISSMLLKVLFLCAYMSHFCTSLLLQYHSPTAENLSLVFNFLTGILSLLCVLCLSVVGILIHTPSRLHLTNLQPKLHKSIQLDVSAAQATVKLQTGLGSAKSRRSGSTDRKGQWWRTDQRGTVTNRG